ncbi:MAG: hypothetical protein V1834_03460 [Candidatus Micrarchaeota archaeon]
MRGQLLSMDFAVGVLLLTVIIGSLIQFNEVMQNDFTQYSRASDRTTSVLAEAVIKSDTLLPVTSPFWSDGYGYCFHGATDECFGTSCTTFASVTRRITTHDFTAVGGGPNDPAVLEVWKCA